MGNFNNSIKSSKRWIDLSTKYNIKRNCIEKREDIIYILLERFFNASLKGSQKFRPKKYFEWLKFIIIELEKETDKQIIIRPHPDSLNEESELAMIEKFRKIKSNLRITFDYQKKLLFDVLDDAFATITYNSGSAIDSLLYGAPNISYDSGSYVYTFVPHNCKNIDDLEMPDIKQWLYDISYINWSLDEISSGEAWLHLKNSVFYIYKGSCLIFSSFEFIFLFLPITFFIYFYLNSKKLTKASKSFLVFASLFFYS